MGIKVTGDKGILSKLALYKERARDAGRAAGYQRALQIMAASQSICVVGPTGLLRASRYVSIPNEQGMIHIGYGVHYAMPVHENLSAHHEHGQAKFLELAFLEFQPTNRQWIKAKTIENIKRGVTLVAGDTPTSYGGD